jgi:uncharacterized membrane protein
MNDRQRALVPFLLLTIGLAGTIAVSAVWLILDRPEPVLIGTFGSLTSSGLTLIALEEIRALRDDLRKDREPRRDLGKKRER